MRLTTAIAAALLLSAALLSTPAAADQTRYSVDRGRSVWHFDVGWTDADGQQHAANFALPARTVEQDLDEPLKYHPNKAAKYVARAVNEWAGTQRGVKLKASVNGEGGVDITGTAKDGDRLAQAMEEAAEVRDQATARYLAERGFVELDGKILPDHARHVAEYADDLAPLVKALGGPGEDPRAFAELALSYVQSIPYEQRAKISDRYRRPLSLLGRNRGDCDSKAVLFLALMRQAWPEVPAAVVYVRGHAYAALGLEAARGDRTFREGGIQWVAVEPVGPAVVHVGELGRPSVRRSRFGRREVLIIPG